MSLEKLGAAVGLDRTAMEQIVAEVKDNHRRLDACPGHAFAKVEMPGFGPAVYRPAKFRCAVCGGTIDAIAHLWYQRGRRDAGRE